MPSSTLEIGQLDAERRAGLIKDFFHRLIMHHTLWFTEVRHQMGEEKALQILGAALDKSWGIQIKRLAKTLGFELKGDLPAALVDMATEDQLALMDSLAANWLANDGIWFQAVEFTAGMNDAKRCNDSCWAHFSPVEAWSIKRMLELPENPGLEGLKQALKFRLYARLNTQSFIDEGPNTLVFQMNECRVQAARKRKNLDDYPCKSAGLVEYAYFARAVDARIKTECIGCPPDKHPEEWYCAWRFTI